MMTQALDRIQEKPARKRKKRKRKKVYNAEPLILQQCSFIHSVVFSLYLII